MRLEYLCDMSLKYREGSVWMQPYGGQEGRGYGEGDGTIVGEKLRGTVRWVNHPRWRSDGVILPDAHGVVQTDDGAHIFLTLQGRTIPHEGGDADQLLTVTFATEDERYCWLNACFCVLEGMIDLTLEAQESMRARVYTCVNELVSTSSESRT